FGAAAGMVACLSVFEFVAVVSTNGDYAFISFAVIGQREFDPLLEYPDGRRAQSVADLLNCALGAAGAVVGAAIGFRVGWQLRKRRAPAPAAESADGGRYRRVASW